jgi:hypothetical protein
MARAFIITSKHKMYFEAAEGQYRYWYTPGKQLKLQISKKVLEAFRKSPAGKRIESYVDIFQVGGGWYEITAREWATPRFGGPRFLLDLASQGLQLWIKAFNLAHVAQVNTNVYRIQTAYVPRSAAIKSAQPHQPSQQQLQALASNFAKA